MKEVKKRQTAPSREAVRTEHGARRRKRKKRSYTLYYLLLLFFVLVSGITLSLTVFFNIETITVTGNQLHPSDAIIEESGIAQGDNLFRINIEKAEKKLIDAFGDIDSVTISRKFPNELLIEVTDAVAVYYLPDEAGYTVLSAGGRILAQNVPQEQADSGIIVKGIDGSGMKLGNYIDKEADEKFKLLEEIDAAIKTADLTDITYIDLANSVELAVCYQNRLIIELGSVSELNYKLNFARNIIETKLEESDSGVIDATKEGKIHFLPGDIHADTSSELSSDPASGQVSDPASDPSSGSGDNASGTNTSSSDTTSAATE